MKKAKILVPAIAALVLSSAAAVTGTVAWFTSSLTEQITQNGVQVVNTSDGNLAVGAITGMVGCTAEGKVVTPGVLTDGSVDIATNKTWKQTATVGKYEEVVGATGPMASGNVQTYRSMTYTIPFTYTFYGSANKFADLMLKPTFGTKPNKNIAPAFRVAFECESADIHFVYAPYAASTTAELKYVNGAEATANYGAGDLYKADETVKMGTFASDGTKNLDIKIWTWFEGCDDACVNGAELFANTEGTVTLDFSIGLRTA